MKKIPGGYVASIYGGKWVFGIGVLMTAILTLITPLVASNVWVFIGVRIAEGFFEGVTFPAMHALLSKWSPPLERTRLSTLCYGGSYLGTVLAFPVSGELASTPSLGWPYIFYIFGAAGVLWFLFWAFLAFDCPAKNPFITKKEREFIQSSLPKEPEKIIVPWKKILTSVPVWALIFINGCSNWVNICFFYKKKKKEFIIFIVHKSLFDGMSRLFTHF